MMELHYVFSVKVWAALTFVVHCIQVDGFIDGHDCLIHYSHHHDGRTQFFCYSKQLTEVPKEFPPNVTDIDISWNTIASILRKDFQNLNCLGTLNISHNSISKVEPHAFKDLISLTELNLSNNGLTRLTKELFDGLISLKILSLESNQISEIDESSLSIFQLNRAKLSNNLLSDINKIHPLFTMPSIKELHIASNNISVFQFFNILNSSSLQILNLSGNPLHTFHIDSAVFPLLKEIDMTYCFTEEHFHWHVPAGVFPNVTSVRLNAVHISVDKFSAILQTFNKSLSHLAITAVRATKVKALMGIICQIPTLTQLTMRNNFLASLDGTALENCSLLKELDLRYNFIFILEKYLASLKKLSILELGNNNISDISVIWHELAMLEKLGLEYNQIEKLNCDAFKNLNNLKTLLLQQNKIYRIDSCTFQHIRGLRNLNLASNSISLLSAAFKDGPPKLKFLSLSSNALVNLKKDDFSGLKSLEILLLNNNKLQEIMPNTFRALGHLKELDLQSNKLNDKSIEPEVFSGLTSLSELYFYSNYLFRNKTLKEPFFSHLKSLSKLSISAQTRHEIKTYLPSNFLSNLTNLHSLWAQNLGLKSLPSDLFKDTRQLTQLGLSGNFLTSLSADVFLPIPKLFRLHLKDTHLVSLDFLIGANLQSLHYLMINDNQITSINDTIIRSVPKLKLLDMSGNTFVCDCSNAWLNNWIVENNVTQVLHAKILECNSPPNLKETKTKLLDVDMHACSVDVEFYCYILTASLVLLTTIIPLVYHFLHLQIVYAYYLLLAYIYDRKQGAGGAKRFMYDAFISYNTNDELWVINELLPKLEGEQGWRLCLHHRDFQPGKPILDNIVDGIYGSRKTICVISRHYLESEWCSREVQVASFRLFDEKKDVLILVFLEDIPVYQLSPYHRLRSLVKKKTFLSWPRAGQDTRVFWEKLRRALSARKQSGDLDPHVNIQHIY